jgi:hypothetical protein
MFRLSVNRISGRRDRSGHRAAGFGHIEADTEALNDDERAIELGRHLIDVAAAEFSRASSVGFSVQFGGIQTRCLAHLQDSDKIGQTVTMPFLSCANRHFVRVCKSRMHSHCFSPDRLRSNRHEMPQPM